MKRRIIWVTIITLAFTACTLGCSGSATPTTFATRTPTLASTRAATPTPTTFCPVGTPEPLWVDPVTSPTDRLTQIVTVVAGNSEAVTVTCESGTFAVTGDFGVHNPAQVTVNLLPNTIHHLHVEARVKKVVQWGNCTYGGYHLSTSTDRNRAPLTIVQQTTPVAPPGTASLPDKLQFVIDPQAPARQLNSPAGVAVAKDGKVYVADTGHDRIQCFSSTGEFLHMWGSRGDGEGQFVAPSAVAVGPGGRVYVVDQGNHRIQYFREPGLFFGMWGSLGDGDGQFDRPSGVAVAADGTVYVADTGNNRIQFFTAEGDFLGKGGSPGKGSGQFSYLTAVAVAPDGSICALDAGAERTRVQRFSSTGQFLGQWGSTGYNEWHLNNPVGLSVAADGTVYVANANSSRVSRFSATGAFLGAWGSLGTGNGEFARPSGVALGPEGTVYVADARLQRVQLFTPTGQFLTTWEYSGDGGTQFGCLRDFACGPSFVAVAPDGSIYVADMLSARVQHLTASGQFLSQWGSCGSGDGQFGCGDEAFNSPSAVAVAPDGTVYVADPVNGRVQRFTAAGQFLGKWGGREGGESTCPSLLAVAPDGTVYVVDGCRHGIQRFSGTGELLHEWEAYGEADGQFDRLSGIAVAPDGTLYATDADRALVQRLSATGGFLGRWGLPAGADGQPSFPNGVAIGPDGTVYVSDYHHDRVLGFSASDEFVGQWGSPGQNPGQFDSPSGLAVAPDGRVVVADTWNHRVQVFAPAYADSWRGEYFANAWLTGSPTLVRDDAEINFQWGTGSPDPCLPVDDFSVRWQRHVWFDSANYDFSVWVSGNLRFWVDGQLFTELGYDSSTGCKGTLDLSEGYHHLRLEYQEDSGQAVVRLNWNVQPPGPWMGIIRIDGPLVIDSAAGRLYTSGQIAGEPQTLVLAATDRGLLASYDITGSLALDSVHGWLYVDWREQGLAVLDAETGALQATIPLPEGEPTWNYTYPAPQADPQTGEVLAFRQNWVHIIDPQRGALVRTIPFDVRQAENSCGDATKPLPIQRAVYDAARRILYLEFVTFSCIPWTGYTIVAYDMASDTELTRIGGAGPTGQATAFDGNLYGSSWYRMGIGYRWMLKEAQAYTVTSDWSSAFASLYVDPARHRVYAGASDSGLDVFDANDMTLLMTILLPLDGQLAGYDPQTDQLYFLSAGSLQPYPGSAIQAIPQPVAGSRPPTAPVQSLVASPTYAQDRTLFGIWEPIQDPQDYGGECWVFGQQGGLLYLSSNEGSTWGQPRNGMGRCQRISAVAVSPDYAHDHTLFAGVVGLGLFKSTDGGQLWLPASAGLGSMGILQILLAPGFARDQTAFVLAQRWEHGLYRSTDGGRTWQMLHAQLKSVAMSPEFDSDHTLIGVVPGYSRPEKVDELRISRDGGEHWEHLGETPGGASVQWLSLAPLFAKWHVLFACSDDGSLYRSSAEGLTWEQVLTQLPPGRKQLVYAPGTEENRPVFLLVLDRYDVSSVSKGTLYRSPDGGLTWEVRPLPEGIVPTALAISPSFGQDGLLFVGTFDGQVVTLQGATP